MAEIWTIKRDGKVVVDNLPREIDALKWIHKHCSCSFDWALRYEGYSVSGKDTITGEVVTLKPYSHYKPKEKQTDEYGWPIR